MSSAANMNRSTSQLLTVDWRSTTKSIPVCVVNYAVGNNNNSQLKENNYDNE